MTDRTEQPADEPKTTCPVCSFANALAKPGIYDICPRCGWEDDPFQSDNPDYAGGANRLSLNQTRGRWQKMIEKGRRGHQ